MKDQLQELYSQIRYEEVEPREGHFSRFEQKLSSKSKKGGLSWKWMSLAASILLLIGFSLGNMNANKTLPLSEISPQMSEAENYFINAINQEIKTLEGQRNLNTEQIIENALDELEELEDAYTLLVKDLKNSGEQRKIINEMINNYQKRLEILQRTLQQIEELKNPNLKQDEIYI